MSRRKMAPPSPVVNGDETTVMLVKLLSYGTMGYNLCGNPRPCREGARLVAKLAKALAKGRISKEWGTAVTAFLDHVEAERGLRKLADNFDMPAIEQLLRGASPQEIGPEWDAPFRR